MFWFQSEQRSRTTGDGPDEDEDKFGDEDSRFMKLAKKVTSRTLQRKGQSGFCSRSRQRPSVLSLTVGPVPTEPAGPPPDQKTTSALNPFQKPSQPQQVSPELQDRFICSSAGSGSSLSVPVLFQVRRGSLLSQPQSVLQKLASISEANLLAPRSSRGFLFQTLSPEKVCGGSDAPQNQVGHTLDLSQGLQNQTGSAGS